MVHALLLLLLVHVIPCFLASSGRVCVDAPENLNCVAWTVDTPNITFSMACLPPEGFTYTNWCAIGISSASLGDMFPSVVTAVQVTPKGYYIEDRDSFIGYRSPPCFAAQISMLLNASLQNGTLYAAWTRPLNVTQQLLDIHYQNVILGPPGMTLIAASSSNQSPALEKCDPQMQLHTYCIPGVKVFF